MDRNDDGELGWQDVIVDVYDYAGNFVGYLSPCQIIIYPDTDYDQLYPYYHPRKNASVYVDSNNDGIYGGEGDWVEPGGMRLLYNHFEWGQIGETNPVDWYGHWQTKMAEFSGDSRYVNGTTYAHLFTDGSDIVIQYWFYYPFNACANRHEGEAEHVHVVVNSQNPAQAQINKVVYYYHHEKAVKNPAQITIVDQTHAKVYVGGYVSSWGMEGHGSHGSYWRAGVHENINPLGDDETVDGNGLVIDFDNYSNIVILPKFSYVNNGNNNINPYIDSYGNNLNFMIFNGLWGHILSTPSAGYKTYSFFYAWVNGWPFLHFLKWFDLPEDVGNIAIAGFVQLFDWEKFNINIAFQASVAIGSDGSADRGWGTPWIWTNMKPISKIPIWLCLGYEFANIGFELGEGDNKANTGLLSRYETGSIAYNASIHFRMRGKVERSVEGYFHRTEQPGDEIHYKFEPSIKIAKNKQLSVFAIGYYGRDRKIDGEIIPNSRRYKASLGSSYTYSFESEKILLFSVIADIYGRNEEKGAAFIFNVLW